jgi:hypothetical protein
MGGVLDLAQEEQLIYYQSDILLGRRFSFLCVLANFVIDKPETENSILQGGAPLMQDNTVPTMQSFDDSISPNDENQPID